MSEAAFKPDWFAVAMASTRLMAEGMLSLAPSDSSRRQDVHCIVCQGDDGAYRGCEFCPGSAWDAA